MKAARPGRYTPRRTARRVFGGAHPMTEMIELQLRYARAALAMRSTYARVLFADPRATLDDLREAMTTLEDTERIARRVFGGTHPFTGRIELPLREARAVLAARERPRA